MKRFYLIILILFLAFNLSFSSVVFSHSKEDYKIIKKAVEKESSARKEVKWFKILVTDSRTQKIKVKITLPISLVELVVNCCPEAKFHLEDDCKINLNKVLQEFKKLDSIALIEVYDEDETVKIWLE